MWMLGRCARHAVGGGRYDRSWAERQRIGSAAWKLLNKHIAFRFESTVKVQKFPTSVRFYYTQRMSY